jgi:hypothetical protein
VSSLAVLTPSYAPDLELCRDLNRSVLEWTQPEVRHHIIVPRRDVGLFARLRGPRTEVSGRSTSWFLVPCWPCQRRTCGSTCGDRIRRSGAG